MRRGLRNRSLVLLLRALDSISEEFWKTFGFNTTESVTWRELYLNLTSLGVGRSNPSIYLNPHNEVLNFDRGISRIGKSVESDWRVVQRLLKNIHDMEPLFSFYIYKVDKKIFKNSRGKSGKFTFIWKYVSPYKRTHLVMFWLIKELRVRPGRTLYSRLYSILHTVVFEPKSAWIYRVRRFSYNYVYFNCRCTLGETYRTTTK